MKDKVKKSALAFAALKAGQQILQDLEGIILDNTKPDLLIFGTEQICRIGAAGTAAYTIDEAISYAEELIVPKFLRGALPLAAATLGAGAIINYFGQYFNMGAQNFGVLEATRQLINNYQENLAKLITFNSEVNAGYLTGAALTIKSGARLLKNIGQKTAYLAKKKRAENKYKEQQNIHQTETAESES